MDAIVSIISSVGFTIMMCLVLRLYKRITQLNWMISDMQQSLYTLEHYYEE